MKISIVTTLHNSACYVDSFHQRSTAVARQLEVDYEIIFVNDGSSDDSLRNAVALTKRHPNVVVVDLSRNFGHHKAMMTGLQHAQGDLIFLIDSDLEEEPEWLTVFLEKLKDSACDVVYGVQKKRKGGGIERWSGTFFYLLFNAISGVGIPRNIVTARLMTRQYVINLLRHKEREMIIAGLWALTGFDQRPVLVHKHCNSETTYTVTRKFSLLVNAITSFSHMPLIGIFYIGMIVFTISSALAILLGIKWLYLSRPIDGWTSVVASIWLLGGLTIALEGVIGMYLSKVFIESKNRPPAIVKQVYKRRRKG